MNFFKKWLTGEAVAGGSEGLARNQCEGLAGRRMMESGDQQAGSRARSPGFGSAVRFRSFAVFAFVSVAVMGAPSAYALDIQGAVTNNFQAWQPSSGSWVPGNATGYAEGDVVALSVEISGTGNSGAAAATQYQIQICLDYNYQGAGTKYAFINAAPWNTFNKPSPTLRGGPITSTNGAAATDWGTVDSVAYVGPGQCGANSLAYDITFTTGNTPKPANFYIYFGARTAKAGLTTAAGATVPAGGGVGSWPVGTFQTSLQRTTGNKTVNFKPSDFASVTPTCRMVRLTSGTAVTPPGSVLLGTAMLNGTCTGTNCSLTLNTSTGMFAGKGLIYNNGQFPATCGPDTECFATQSPSPFTTTSPGFSLAGLVIGAITFTGPSSYSYTGGLFGSHSGTYKTVDCDTQSVPEPASFPLVLLSLAGLGLAGWVQARRRSRQQAARLH